MAVFAFDYNAWSARYALLVPYVNSALASAYFAEAALYVDNTDASVVSDATKRGIVLNAIVAHIAVLEGAASGGIPTGIVGRVASATQGSVTVATEHTLPGTAAWYAQTSHGASAWQMLKPYRMAFYIAPDARPNDVIDGLWQGMVR